MLLKKRSVFTGREVEMEIDCTPEDVVRWQRSRRPIQEMIPGLTSNEREFLLSGATPQEWDELFDDRDKQERDWAQARNQ